MNYSELEKIEHKKFTQKLYARKPEQKKKRREYQTQYRKDHPDRVKETTKKCYYKYRNERLSKARQFQKLPCKDPYLQDVVTYNCMTLRIRNHPEIYGNVTAKEYMIHIPTIKGLDLLSEEQKKEVKALPRSLMDALDALKEDHDYLTAGGVFPQELIDLWIEKKKADYQKVHSIPHPAEFSLYYDL
jgi:hypothetical protein